MANIKRGPIDIHCLYGQMSPLQQAYGLRIIGGHSWSSDVDSYYDCNARTFEFYSISFLFEGEGKYWTAESGEIDIKAPAFVMMAPGVVNRYGGAHGKAYAEDSITFCGSIADNLLRSGVFKTGVFQTSILRKIPAIVEMSHNPSAAFQLNANMELQKLIFEIYNERLQSAGSPGIMQKIICELSAHPEKWFQVEHLAEMAEMSVATFRRRFFQETGMLPKRYIEELKINNAAADLLKKPSKKIGVIASRYGYFDQYHFSRRFKAVKGCSPEQYRKTFS